MSERPTAGPPVVAFELNPHSASKRPEQLVNVLTRVLSGEFPEAFEQIEVVHEPETAVVKLSKLETLDQKSAEAVARRARSVFNDFVTSPWY